MPGSRMEDSSAFTHEAHTTIRNISNVAILKFAQYPFLALSLVLIPRMLGTQGYGEYALVISIITVAASIIDFGAGGELFGRFVPELQVAQQSHGISKLASN